MILAEMPFGVSRARKRNRRLRILHMISRYAPRLLFPLLDHGRIADDVDLALVIGEAHPPAEARLVKITKLRLIGVMVRRAEQRAAQPAARDIRKIAFQRLRLRDFDCVEIVAQTGECRVLEKPAIGRDRSVFAELKKPASGSL